MEIGSVVGLSNEQIDEIRRVREWLVVRTKLDGRSVLTQRCPWCGQTKNAALPFDGHRTVLGQLDCDNRQFWDAVAGTGTGALTGPMSFTYDPAPATQDLDLLEAGRFILETPINHPAMATVPLLVDNSRGNSEDLAAQKVIAGDGSSIWHRVYRGVVLGWTAWRRTDGIGVSGSSIVLPAPNGTLHEITVTDGGDLSVQEA